MHYWILLGVSVCGDWDGCDCRCDPGKIAVMETEKGNAVKHRARKESAKRWFSDCILARFFQLGRSSRIQASSTPPLQKPQR